MIDPSTQFTLSQVSTVLLYADHASAHRFYALPARPRLARDESGHPELNLMLYGKGQGSSFQATGGFLNLTASLALDEQERRTLVTALSARLAEAAKGKPGSSSPEIELAGPDWQDGEAVLKLGEAELAKGKPSLSGDNRVSFSTSLAPETAKALKEAWEAGRAELSLVYRLTAVAAERSERSGSTQAEEEARSPGKTFHAATQAAYELKSIRAVPFSIVIAGSPEISTDALQGSLQVIAL
jgi:hypothetical protein